MRILFYFLLLLPPVLYAQEKNTLNLSEAYELALKNYPLVKQRALIKQTSGINIDILGSGFLPQFSISGQATYQSDVTSINVPIPGFSFNPPSKDQYKILADINQLIYDGGNIREQKNMLHLNEAAEQQKLEVELYTLKDRINQLFLGVLFLDGQLKQADLIKNDLNTGIKKIEAQISNGVAFRSNLNVLKAEMLKADQHTIELKAAMKGLTDVLGLFIDRNVTDSVLLKMPEVPVLNYTANIQRPEIKYYSTQESLLNGQFKLIDSRNRPKAGLFIQGGYGKPGLNFLKNDFTFFYTAGIRFNWLFGGLYTMKKEKELITQNKKGVGIRKETFLLNTNTALKQQEAEINKLEQLIARDNEIIDLRMKVKEAANAQLENGVITANDYLREVNAEDQSKQTLISHRIQLLQARVNYLAISGKQ